MSSVKGKYLKDESGTKFSPVTSPYTVIGSSGTNLPIYLDGETLFSGKVQGSQTLSGVDWGEYPYLWFQMLLVSSNLNYYSWVRITKDLHNKNTAILSTNGIVVGSAHLYIDAKNMFRLTNNNTNALQGSDHAQNEIWVSKVIGIPPM